MQLTQPATGPCLSLGGQPFLTWRLHTRHSSTLLARCDQSTTPGCPALKSESQNWMKAAAASFFVASTVGPRYLPVSYPAAIVAAFSYGAGSSSGPREPSKSANRLEKTKSVPDRPIDANCAELWIGPVVDVSQVYDYPSSWPLSLPTCCWLHCQLGSSYGLHSASSTVRARRGRLCIRSVGPLYSSGPPNWGFRLEGRRVSFLPPQAR